MKLRTPEAWIQGKDKGMEIRLWHFKIWWLSRWEEIRERISKRFSPEECRGCKYWGKYGCMASVDYFESEGSNSCGFVLQGLIGSFPSIPPDRYEELVKLYERRTNNF